MHTERRRASASELSVVITLVLQLCFVVWFAATMRSEVNQLQMLVTEIRVGQRLMQTDINNLKTDNAVIKARVSK